MGRKWGAGAGVRVVGAEQEDKHKVQVGRTGGPGVLVRRLQGIYLLGRELVGAGEESGGQGWLLEGQAASSTAGTLMICTCTHLWTEQLC